MTRPHKPKWKWEKPGPKRAVVPAELAAEILAFRKSADRALRLFDRLAPKLREAAESKTVPKMALARELSWSRQRMDKWLRGKGGDHL